MNAHGQTLLYIVGQIGCASCTATKAERPGKFGDPPERSKTRSSCGVVGVKMIVLSGFGKFPLSPQLGVYVDGYLMPSFSAAAASCEKERSYAPNRHWNPQQS